MKVSRECAGALATTMKHEFSLRVDPAKVAETWQNRLNELNIDEEQARTCYRRFADAWTHREKPTLHDLCKFIGLQLLGRRRGSLYRPPEDRCGLCGDHGLIPCALPEGHGRAGLRPVKGFVPGETWTDTRVWAVSLPCKCSQGSAYAKEGLSERWCTVRDQWIEYYAANAKEGSPAVWQARFLRRCREGYEQAEKGRPAADPELVASADVADGEIPF